MRTTFLVRIATYNIVHNISKMQNLMEIMMVVLPEPEMYRHKVKDFKKLKKKIRHIKLRHLYRFDNHKKRLLLQF